MLAKNVARLRVATEANKTSDKADPNAAFGLYGAEGLEGPYDATPSGLANRLDCFSERHQKSSNVAMGGIQ